MLPDYLIKGLMAVAISFGLAACSQEAEDQADQSANVTEETAEAQPAEETAAEAYVPPEDASEAIVKAINHPYRPAEDVERDVYRKPGHVLSFYGVEPGMTVLDILSAGGYYTELLQRVVGRAGHVIAHNNAAAIAYDSKDYEARYKDGRLDQVERYIADLNDIDLAPNSVDVAMMTLNYHDIYFVTPPEAKIQWPHIDAETFLANVYRALKPGGVFGVLDHRAPDDAASETGTTLHRISPKLVKEQVEAAGFVLEAEADFLANPDDTLDKNVFDPTIRHHTDRFVMRFRKPAEGM